MRRRRRHAMTRYHHPNPLSDGAKIGLAIAGAVVVAGGLTYALTRPAAAATSSPSGSSGGAVMPSSFPQVPLQQGQHYTMVFWLPTNQGSGSPAFTPTVIATGLTAMGFQLDSGTLPVQTGGPVPTPGTLTMAGADPAKIQQLQQMGLQWNQWTARGTWTAPSVANANSALDTAVQSATAG